MTSDQKHWRDIADESETDEDYECAMRQLCKAVDAEEEYDMNIPLGSGEI